MGFVDVWDVGTYPCSLKGHLESSTTLLRSYRRQEREQDASRARNPLVRSTPDEDAVWQAYHQFTWGVGDWMAAQGLSVRAWHFTNLCSHELEVILRDGMRPPMDGTLETRIQHAMNEHGLPASIANSIARNSVYHERREDGGGRNIWFALKPFPKDSADVQWLLDYWGGEAAFWNAPEDHRKQLQEIGIPTVLEVEIPMQLIEDAMRRLIGECVVEFFEQDIGVYGYAGLCDVRTASSLDASRILKAHRYGDPVFDQIGRTYPSGIKIAH